MGRLQETGQSDAMSQNSGVQLDYDSNSTAQKNIKAHKKLTDKTRFMDSEDDYGWEEFEALEDFE